MPALVTQSARVVRSNGREIEAPRSVEEIRSACVVKDSAGQKLA